MKWQFEKTRPELGAAVLIAWGRGRPTGIVDVLEAAGPGHLACCFRVQIDEGARPFLPGRGPVAEVWRCSANEGRTWWRCYEGIVPAGRLPRPGDERLPSLDDE